MSTANVQFLVDYLAKVMPNMFSNNDRTKMPRSSKPVLINWWIQDYHLVSNLPFVILIQLIYQYNIYLKNQPNTAFIYPCSGRTDKSIDAARHKIQLDGLGWYYLGMLKPCSWREMITTVNSYLDQKTTEQIWLDKFKNVLIANCQSCNSPITYTSCKIKRKYFDHIITCQTCADHDR